MAVSTKFTETLTKTKMYVGPARLGLVAYGSTPPVDLGGLDVDTNLVIRPTGELLFDEVHRKGSPHAVYLIRSGIEVEANLRERDINLIAEIIGKTTTAVTDNSLESPKNKEVGWGDQTQPTPLPFWVAQVQIPQNSAASPLYDFCQLLKAYIDPTAWELSFGRNGKQSVPVKLIGIQDDTHATYPNAVAVWTSEYV